MALLRSGRCQAGQIMFVIGSLSVGGAERQLVSVATGLRKRGWKTSVFVFSRSGPLLSELEAQGVPVFGVTPVEQEKRGLMKRFWIWVRLIKGAIQFINILRGNKDLILHFFLPTAYIIGGTLSCIVGGQPRIMSRRSLNIYQRKRPIYRWIEYFLHSRMNVLLGNSLAVVRELELEAKGDTPVRLIYNGVGLVSANAYSHGQIRRELGIKESALVFIIVANIIPYKGHADLLVALANIRDKLPLDWNLICIGRDDGILSSLQDQAKLLAISQNIRWLGGRMNVEDYLPEADIFVSASHEEGFSNAVLEAMLAGLPIVATIVGGNPEAIIDNVTGYTAPPNDPYELGLALLKLAGDMDRKIMGKRAQQYVKNRFSMKACLDKYEEIYRQVI
jgi:glycosyltransferase involved in cell wall biosynthesis